MLEKLTGVKSKVLFRAPCKNILLETLTECTIGNELIQPILKQCINLQDIWLFVATFCPAFIYVIHLLVFANVTAGKPIMYEKTFLHDIAVQNFTKYAVPVRHSAPTPVRSLAFTHICVELHS